MAATYQQMVDRLQTLINRSDAAAQVAPTSGNTLNILNDCYERAQRRAYRSGHLMVPPFEESINYNVAAGENSLTIPQGYFARRYSTVRATDADDANLQFTMETVAPEAIENRVLDRRVGLPTRIAYGPRRWLIDPPTNPVTVTVHYYKELADITTITDASQEHWLVNYADDYLLYLAAAEAGIYFRHLDPQTVAAFEQKAEQIAQSIREQYVDQLESGSDLNWGTGYTRPGRYSIGSGGVRY